MIRKKVLFITWDGPQTNYLDGLFMPIFFEISKKLSINFHIIQFTWNNPHKIKSNRSIALNYNISYQAFPITVKPLGLGKVIALFKGVNYLNNYIKEKEIDIIMPRSIFPAIMVNRKKSNKKILYDADGLSIEERVDFSKLTRNSILYSWLKKEENNMLRRADEVITRTQKAIDFHISNIGESYRKKFNIVINGRDSNLFKPNLTKREEYRKELKINENEIVFVYCGSLGPQYGWNEMINIFKKYKEINRNSKFIILTGSLEFASENIHKDMIDSILVKNIPYSEIPDYLNISDIAFAIRLPKISMKGVAPIKLGEYMLMGLPIIASEGIGDTEEILSKTDHCYLYRHSDFENMENDIDNIEEIITFVNIKAGLKSEKIRELGCEFYSLENSVESYLKPFEKLI